MPVTPTPKPPYYAAIFSGSRKASAGADYDAMGERMATLAQEQPGFIGFEGGTEDPDRFSVFVSYWRSDADILAWKAIGEHLVAQERGKQLWYAAYKIRIAKVERDYGKET